MKYPIVEVNWLDAHGCDEGWTRPKKSHRRPRKIRTVGMLVDEDDAVLVVALSYDKHAGTLAGSITILKTNITEMRTL